MRRLLYDVTHAMRRLPNHLLVWEETRNEQTVTLIALKGRAHAARTALKALAPEGAAAAAAAVAAEVVPARATAIPAPPMTTNGAALSATEQRYQLKASKVAAKTLPVRSPASPRALNPIAPAFVPTFTAASAVKAPAPVDGEPLTWVESEQLAARRLQAQCDTPGSLLTTDY